MDKRPTFKPGQWQVERERSRIDRRTPPPPFREAASVASVVPALMKRLGLEDQHWTELLAAEWPKLVGDAVAKHTRPGRVHRENLVVFVDSSVWLNELARYGKDQIQTNLRKRFGDNKIKSVSFQLDPEAKSGQGSSAGDHQRR
jgi:predicted nucleic acid-binding Zn ribbon protein